MQSDLLLLPLVFVFVAVALVTGSLSWYVVTQWGPGRRRLEQVMQPAQRSSFLLDTPQLDPHSSLTAERLLKVLPPASGYLRRRMSLAGFHGDSPVIAYRLAEFVLPIVLGVPPLLLLDAPTSVFVALLGAAMGYMTPSFVLGRRIRKRQREIQNGLADLLDLLVLCLEAGSGLDQSIVKASDELEVAYPALADQLHILISETRAGKPRLEAFRGLADRTKVEDVRSLVAMLVQTDRFGTSVAQALRTQANVCRTKRRQRAEERAAKVSVKMVFPLVFCLFPAFYVVMLGPAYIQFIRVLGE